MKLKILSIALLALLVPSIAFAAVFKSNENMSADEVIEGNGYIFGGDLIVAGTVTGDLYLAGGNVVLSGDNAKIGGDLVLAGGDIIVDVEVAGDVLIAGGTITFIGSSGGDVRIFGGGVTVDGEIGGELLINGGDVIIGPNAKVKGEVVVNAGSVNIDPSAKLSGGKKINAGERDVKKKFTDTKKADYVHKGFWMGRVIMILMLLIVAAIFYSLFPKLVGRLTKQANEGSEFWKSFGLGFLLLILIPIAAVISFITIIGAWLGLILLVYMCAMLLLSTALSGILFGGILKKMISKSKKVTIDWGWVIAGVVILHLATQLPIVGGLLAFVFILFTWGNIARVQWALLRKA